MARKKSTSKKTTRKKATRKTTAKKTARRRKTHTPKVAKHGKTAAERRRYIAYRKDVDVVKKKHYG